MDLFHLFLKEATFPMHYFRVKIKSGLLGYYPTSSISYLYLHGMAPCPKANGNGEMKTRQTVDQQPHRLYITGCC
jgi:hypothetical protein